MTCELSARPYILYETAAMLYKFVNGISYRSALSLHPDGEAGSQWGVRKADELQQILEESCQGLSRNDPQLCRFFAEAGPNEQQEICLAYLMIFSFFTLREPDFRGNIEAIRSNWKLIREKGGWVESYSRMGLNFSYGADCPGDFLDQVCRLDLPAEFQISLCFALRRFDQTLDELAELMEPVAAVLEQNLTKVRWIWEQRTEYWNRYSPLDYVTETAGQQVFAPEARVKAAIFVMNQNCLLVKESEADPGCSYLYIGCGASIEIPKRDLQRTCQLMSLALKAVSDRKRLELLHRLSRERAYGIELAEAMEIDPSNMSRNLALLCSYGFLRQEKVGQKIFYETDRAAVQNFCRQLERFILD